jgi:hypothetical protein
MAGLVYNISRDGIFILSTIMPRVNTIVEILIPMPAKKKLLLPISGQVVHRGKNGFGLMFCELAAAARLFVDKVLMRGSCFS